jgi:hypothetical protein
MRAEIYTGENELIRFSNDKTEKAVIKGRNGKKIIIWVLSYADSLRF